MFVIRNKEGYPVLLGEMLDLDGPMNRCMVSGLTREDAQRILNERNAEDGGMEDCEVVPLSYIIDENGDFREPHLNIEDYNSYFRGVFHSEIAEDLE